MTESESQLAPSGSDPPPIRGAGFWVRALAHGIDFLILFSVSCLIMLPFLFRAFREGMATDPTALSYPIWVDLLYQLFIAVVVITIWRKFQTTPGKAIFKLKIVDYRDGNRPEIWRLIVRFVGYLVAMVPIPAPLLVKVFPSLHNVPIYGGLMDKWQMQFPLFLGFFWILVDRRNRGWHDLLSGTVTTRREAESLTEAA